MNRKSSRNSKAPGTQSDPFLSALCGLFDFIEDLQFWIKDRTGRYRRVNRGFLLNYSLERPEQVIGKTDCDLSPAHLADQFRLDDERVFAGHPIINRVEMVGRFDHTASWSLTSKVPLRDARGRVVATAGITQPLKGRVVEQYWPTAALGRAVAFIRGHFATPMANRQLATVAGLSVRAFERRFREAFRLSPQQYIKRLRVRMACHTLVYSNKPLAQVATEHGFCDQSHFTREFHSQTGVTPRQYRERYRAACRVSSKF